MSTELNLPGAIPVSKYADDQTLNDIAKSANWLPRMQLMQSGTKLVKQKKAEQGTLCIVKNKDSVINLGEMVDLWVISWRPCAVRVADDDVVSFYNPKDPEFLSIVDEAKADSQSGCMYGPQFLVFVPAHEIYCGFHCNNPTLRNVAEEIAGLCRKGPAKATFESHLIEGKKYSWFGVKANPCSAMLTAPEPEMLMSQASEFANPPERLLEVTEPATGRER